MDAKTAQIRMSGDFTFNTRHDFQKASYTALSNKQANRICVDLGAVSYVDSSALGMLLLLRDKAQAVSKTVTLKGATGTVEQILRVANFDRLFAPC